ncbi:MAG: 2-amino-4-hydroxy-6-hydroxymethyldihydropteridine diphosphokinase [Armatimonadetes bacterium]|nr:2-amino-4-hydroxy-6-hydroxymethyldihydropteridine diphosphokinase [Armatimonadota bacterium]
MTVTPVPVAVALGANLGPAKETIGQALVRLAGILEDMRVSGLYETAAMYVADQPDFLNMVAVGSTRLGPIGLVQWCKATERELGRVPGEPNGPRMIDLDVLQYGVLELDSNMLRVPHPRSSERRFVMEPWAEADPGATLPGGKRILDWKDDAALQGQAVRRASDAPLSVPSR